jgi:hypothetical protein
VDHAEGHQQGQGEGRGDQGLEEEGLLHGCLL